MKRSVGAPRGNQNARKHGFYSNILTPDEKRHLKYAPNVQGLDAEINLLRVKIKSVVEHDPDNLKLISTAVSTLARLLRARFKISGPDRKVSRFAAALQGVFEKYAYLLPLNPGEDPLSAEKGQLPPDFQPEDLHDSD